MEGAEKGVRVSLADVTNMNAINYRHILLVDEFDKALVGVHAGESFIGMEYFMFQIRGQRDTPLASSHWRI